jgi:protein NrfC
MKRGCTHTIDSGPQITRRDFVKYSGMAVVAICAGGCEPAGERETAAWGFLLADMRKCQGCMSCMLACSLVHHGEINLSLARLQIQQDPYGCYPDDITIVQCRQCVEPACLDACPTGALSRDPDNGHVATVNVDTCIGCKSCISACPHTPGRAVWNAEGNHAQKCDMCADTPFWNRAGGSAVRPVCIEACPVGALAFTQVIPDQESPDSYSVNLRDWQWRKLGYPVL